MHKIMFIKMCLTMEPYIDKINCNKSEKSSHHIVVQCLYFIIIINDDCKTYNVCANLNLHSQCSQQPGFTKVSDFNYTKIITNTNQGRQDRIFVYKAPSPRVTKYSGHLSLVTSMRSNALSVLWQPCMHFLF